MTPTKTKIFNMLKYIDDGILLTDSENNKFVNKGLAETYIENIDNKIHLSVIDNSYESPILYRYVFNCDLKNLKNKVREVLDEYNSENRKELGDYEALDALVWYNGYTDIIRYWNKLAEQTPKQGYVPYKIAFNNLQEKFRASMLDISQVQVLWVVAVWKFGNYGTSPNSGWIENLNDFREWCDAITTTVGSEENYWYTTFSDDSCSEVYTFEF